MNISSIWGSFLELVSRTGRDCVLDVVAGRISGFVNCGDGAVLVQVRIGGAVRMAQRGQAGVAQAQLALQFYADGRRHQRFARLGAAGRFRGARRRGRRSGRAAGAAYGAVRPILTQQRQVL